MALKRLLKEFKNIDYNYFYSCMPQNDNILIWDFTMIGPPDTLYEGGIFNGSIICPANYPNEPPVVKFKKILHPNIFENGTVCISILHAGSDAYGYEKDGERWNPSHSINSIMLSILSMLSAPNFDSPANITASVTWKDNPEKYKKMVYSMVALSQK